MTSLVISSCGVLNERLAAGTQIAGSSQSDALAEGIGGGSLEEEINDLSEPGAIETAVHLTLEALPTSTPIEILREVTSLVDNPVTVTPDLSTDTPEPTITVQGAQFTALANTLTAIVASSTPTVEGTPDPNAQPTSTPTPTITPTNFTPTATDVLCNALRYVADVTIPDGTALQPGEVFFKTWRVQNVGSCAWGNNYAIVYHSGFQMNGTSPLFLGVSIQPGQFVNLTVQLTTPTQTGTYRSNWGLQDLENNFFGLGDNFDEPFWVEIFVTGGSAPGFTDPAATDPPFFPANP